ncbi:MAG: hypothetical protein HYZ75_11025 [Elusimicrobia bacterium]|nr:hypothetical protein [Elusimicrobiota bacterium]
MHKAIIAAAILSFSGCGANKNLDASSKRPISKILVLIKNPDQPALVSMDPAAGGAAGLLGGLIGGALYAATIHRSAAELLPLKNRLNACDFPSRLEAQIHEDLAALLSSGADTAVNDPFRRFFAGKSPTPDDKLLAMEAARAQGITHIMAVSLLFHGIYYSQDAKSFYDVTAAGSLFDSNNPEKAVWSDAANARNLSDKTAYMKLSSELQQDGAEVCAQLLGRGAAVSHRFAAKLGVPRFKTALDPYANFRR